MQQLGYIAFCRSNYLIGSYREKLASKTYINPKLL